MYTANQSALESFILHTDIRLYKKTHTHKKKPKEMASLDPIATKKKTKKNKKKKKTNKQKKKKKKKKKQKQKKKQQL